MAYVRKVIPALDQQYDITGDFMFVQHADLHPTSNRSTMHGTPIYMSGYEIARLHREVMRHIELLHRAAINMERMLEGRPLITNEQYEGG